MLERMTTVSQTNADFIFITHVDPVSAPSEAVSNKAEWVFEIFSSTEHCKLTTYGGAAGHCPRVHDAYSIKRLAL